MKVLIACIAMLAMASALSQTQWTLNELSAAIQNPATPPQMLPYLEEALNQLMMDTWQGTGAGSIVVAMPVDMMPVMPVMPVLPEVPAVVAPVMPVVPVLPEVPVEQTQWTLEQLSAAIQNPATPSQMLPYLVAALDELMDLIWQGKPADSIVVAMPVDVMPVMPVLPEVPTEVTPVTPVMPVVPEVPVEQNPISSSPLVQIMINIAA